MPELLVHMDNPLTTIHALVPSLQEASREKAEEYLARVATALLEGWGDELESLCDVSRLRRGDELDRILSDMLNDFKADESTNGIMKSAVIVNHQWVIKLGDNAIMEMQEYEDHAGNDYQHIMVPTVWLGDIGCVALKVEVPEIQEDYYQFEDDDHEEWYQDFKNDSGVPDMHRGNVGIWQGRMVAIDWGGGC